MPIMSNDEIYSFLTESNLIMKLATLSADGWPYIIPIWYQYNGSYLTALGRQQSRWITHIRKDSRVSACIDTPQAPYKRVIIKGIATIDNDQFLGDWESMAHRYMGSDIGRTYYESTKRTPRILVKIKPNLVTSWSGPGWHPRYEGWSDSSL